MLVAMILLAVAAYYFFYSNLFKGTNTVSHAIANQGVIEIHPFAVAAESVGLHSFASGTVFVEAADDGSCIIRIVSQLEIDPEDWGGVSFSMPGHLTVKQLTSSYPEDGTLDEIAGWPATWISTDTEQKYKTFVEIGRDRGHHSTRGGKGSVLIEMVSVPDMPIPDSFPIGISIGGYNKNGYDVMGAEYITIPITFKERE
jgi:hypothetical protein